MASSSSLLNNLDSEVSRFKSTVDSAVSRVESGVSAIKTSTDQIYNRIQGFKKTMLEGEEKSIATENILKIDQKINEQLGHYQSIRNSVIGIVRDLDFNLVRKSTVAELSEELWMSSSRYWLSYALLALNAWIQDNEEIALNAVKETIRRDKVKGSLFFCLLNLRFGRHEAAKAWLLEYFNAVDPVNPPKESALVLQAFLIGVFGTDAVIESSVREMIDGWINEIHTDESISTELTESYLAYIKTVGYTEKTEFATLAAHCKNYQEIVDSLTDSGRFGVILESLKALDSEEVVAVERDFIERVDGVLQDLMNNYDDEEQRLRNEQKYYRLINENEGDIEAAKAQYEALGIGDDTVSNIGNQMVNWGIMPENVDKCVSKFAVQKTKEWYGLAVDKFDAEIRQKKPKAYELGIDLWQGTITDEEKEKVKENLENTYKSQKTSLCILTKPNIIMTIVSVVIIALSLVIGANATVYGYFGVAAGGILFAIVLINVIIALKKFPARIENATDILYKCFDEIDGFDAEMAKRTETKNSVKEKLYYI